MAISNKFGSMVLTTGNKSEMSVGYATLYGDMNGGFNPIKDVYKMDVYRLAIWRNAHRPEALRGPLRDLIPERIITKAPTAELRENQTDQDTLPPMMRSTTSSPVWSRMRCRSLISSSAAMPRHW